MEVSAVVGDCRRAIRFASVHLPYEEPDLPSAIMRDIVQNSAEERRVIILRIDTNAHHILRRSMVINPRCESLIEYMVSTNLRSYTHGEPSGQ